MLCVLCTLLFSTIIHAQSFEEGLDAYSAGNYDTAAKIWAELAAAGHQLSQYNLALMYENGTGLDKRTDLAAFWYRLSALQGDMLSQFNLGGLYFNGDGVPQVFDDARIWWRLAAEQGYAPAQYNLAVLLLTNYAFASNNPLIHNLLEAASASGHIDSIKLMRTLQQINSNPSEDSTTLFKFHPVDSTLLRTEEPIAEKFPGWFNKPLDLKNIQPKHFTIEIGPFLTLQDGEALAQEWQLASPGIVVRVKKLNPGVFIYFGQFETRIDVEEAIKELKAAHHRQGIIIKKRTIRKVMRKLNL